MNLLKTLIGLALSTISLSASAQDTIVFRNGDSLTVSVKEISNEVVKYKRFSNPDGPLYIDIRDDISSIIYENGDIDYFGEIDATEPQPHVYATPVDIQTVFYGDSLRVNRKSPSGLEIMPERGQLSVKQSYGLLGKDFDWFYANVQRMHSGCQLVVWGGITTVVSAILLGNGVSGSEVLVDDSFFVSGTSYPYYYYETEPIVPLVVVGATGLCVSSAMIISGIVKFVSGKRICKEIVSRYNKNILGDETKPKPHDNISFGFDVKGNGLSFSLNF